jgi:hypothetical protein
VELEVFLEVGVAEVALGLLAVLRREGEEEREQGGMGCDGRRTSSSTSTTTS